MTQLGLLSGIRDSRDVKRLSRDKLERLATEIRHEILETVSANGGHLSSNLGAVELAIALHYCFDTPHDRIIWDVGHQAYPHKLLTGRKDRFRTIRQYEGLSGFCKREESPYDVFGAGHAATSISAALGVKEALQKKGDRSKVIAVIGDGGLTCGLAFEGLNQAGDLERDLIVVLNHNEMSISGNVGAMSKWFSERLTGSKYQQFRSEVKNLLGSFPVLGPEMMKLIRRVVESTKVLLTPGILFEGFNFQYVGPVDGHDIGKMLSTFERIRPMTGPILVHVVTKKGNGYRLAEEDPERFHGIGPFDLATGKNVKQASSPPSYTQIFSDAMVELGAEHTNMVAITAAMPSGTGLAEFAKTFPDRFYDVGIAESHAVTFAAGMATEGLKPVVAIYSTFLQRAYDMIIHDVALQNLPVLFALDRGGLVGDDGPTHHGVFDLSYLRNIPNMVIASPKDEDELRDMLLTGVLHNGPFALRYPRGNGEGVEVKHKPESIPIGKAEVVYEPKHKPRVAILAVGSRVWEAYRAAKRLKKSSKLSCRVVNARFIKPLDAELFAKAVEDVDVVVTIEENTVIGGFGSAVLEWMQENDIRSPHVLRLGVPDRFVHQGPQSLLWKEIGLDAEGIARSIADAVHVELSAIHEVG
jgi:1-deoxy-D-xylulose-5-phosphate synthase